MCPGDLGSEQVSSLLASLINVGATSDMQDRGLRIVAVVQMLPDLLLKVVSLAATHDLQATHFKRLPLATSVQEHQGRVCLRLLQSLSIACAYTAGQPTNC